MKHFYKITYIWKHCLQLLQYLDRITRTITRHPYTWTTKVLRNSFQSVLYAARTFSRQECSTIEIGFCIRLYRVTFFVRFSGYCILQINQVSTNLTIEFSNIKGNQIKKLFRRGKTLALKL